ncbi:probable 6-phosphogluconolactonase 4, chloroplastic [Miscanthus floridulus]|uniref:probable 6-phosphogluconolactonase 4, chloroplastic n=1 Tax=Miscanthus floridulus TaxID=154761 RepID=UPI00345A8B33
MGAGTTDSVDGVGGGVGSSSFSGGWRMARRFSSSSGRAGRWAWAGGAAGAGHLRRVEASGGERLLRWPAPPPSSSSSRGPGARGVAVAAGRGAARWWAAGRTGRPAALRWGARGSGGGLGPRPPESKQPRRQLGLPSNRLDSEKLIIFDAEEDLAASLAKYTAELSAKFAAERGAFTVVLSGGSLVKALRKLAEPPYLEAVDWSKWHVFWVDERVVPKDHADSNYKLASDEFLSKVPIPAD